MPASIVMLLSLVRLTVATPFYSDGNVRNFCCDTQIVGTIWSENETIIVNTRTIATSMT